MIPRPLSRRATGERSHLGPGLEIAADEASTEAADLLATELWAATRRSVGRVVDASAGSPGSIRLRVGEVPGAPSSPESYRLAAGADGVEIVGASAAGVFYGTRSLLQLLPASVLRRGALEPAVERLELPGVEIVDGPRFAWRGAHLDVARHFLGKQWILRLIDLLALHKVNVLHLHLTDDQGWRLPVDKWPRLTEVGAWRRESSAGHASEGRFDGVPHGGYYSKDDLREIVGYASVRHISVVPEIDMPGHMQAAVAAYPELGNGSGQWEVMTSWGISDHVLNLEASTLEFCRDVLTEVLEIFPSRYIHIGGDECPTVEWEQSEHAQRLKGELGVADERALQGWFTAQMAEFLTSRGRVLVGWDEILEGGPPPGSVVMAWRAQREGLAAAMAGLDVVMAPMQWLYFDWAYEDSPREPLAIWPGTSVQRVYEYEPVPQRLDPDRVHHVLGTQCQLWTEYVADPRHAEYLYFPRVSAFAEVAWSPADRDWPGFEERLVEHLTRLDALGVNYRPLDGPTPGQARVWTG